MNAEADNDHFASASATYINAYAVIHAGCSTAPHALHEQVNCIFLLIFQLKKFHSPQYHF